MNPLLFWNSWPAVYKRIFWFSTLLLCAAVLALWFFYFSTPSPALTWHSVQEQDLQEIPVYTFQRGLFDLSIHGDNYIIFERLLANPLDTKDIFSYFFLSVLILFMVLMITIITTLSRFWSLLGLGLFILFIVSFRLEVVAVFGLYNKLFTIIVLALYIPLAYYLNAFTNSFSFFKRLVLFTAITAVVATCIALFAEVPKPFLHLAATGVTVGIALTGIFILTVAPEIIAFFVFIVSSGARQTKSLNHFLIISVVYIINLVLIYVSRAGIVEWNFLNINLFLLLTISGLIGIWGFRERRSQYENIIEADPFGVFFIIGLGTVCFGTIAYFIAQANDPVLEAINDLILYSHIGYGIIFVIYILSNFIGLLGNNLPTYKVLYKPTNMPYFTSRFAGMIVTLGFIFVNAWQVPVHNAMAGYYNAAGDLYMSIKNIKLAEGFYEKAGEYGFLNHHSNFMIADIEASRNNTLKERKYYKRASERRPTEMSFLNYSQTYQREQNWIESLLALNEAAKALPKSGTIKNTQGLVYAKLHMTDSALFAFNEARSLSSIKNSAELNLVGLAAKEGLMIDADSLYNLIGSTSLGVEANALAFANLQQKKINMTVQATDTVLNLFSATLYNNYILNHLDKPDTSFISRVIEISNKSINSDYSEALLFSSALALYQNGQVDRAFHLIQQIIIYSTNQGKYNNILALWTLEQDAPAAALDYLAFAINQNYNAAQLTTAIAQAEAHHIDQAIVAWDSVARQRDSTTMQMAGSMLRVLRTSPASIATLSDDEKYAYCRYRLSASDTVTLKSVIKSIKNEDLRAKAILDGAQKLYQLDETEAAQSIFQLVKGLHFSDKKIYDGIQFFELLLLAKQNNIQGLEAQLKKNTEFGDHHQNENMYFTALIQIASGNTGSARKNFEKLKSVNPYFDDAVVAAAQYFKANSKDHLKAYEILVEASLANPHSVKILKAYSLEAARMGFDEYAKSSIDKLSQLISAQSFRKFMLDNQQTFSVLSF